MKKDTQKEFMVAKARLNIAQREAVEAIEGPVMVVAGPGTGKTQVLTLRMANILLETDTRPENILALTFTEAAAANMRARLSGYIGSDAYRVRIETFHGFCQNIIRNYGEHLEALEGSEIANDIEKFEILELSLMSIPYGGLRKFGSGIASDNISKIQQSISAIKREGFTSEEFETLVDREITNFELRDDKHSTRGSRKGLLSDKAMKEQTLLVRNKELSLIYKKYQDELQARSLYDYDDMLLAVLHAMEASTPESGIKPFLQEEHQYVLVDEHQDTNSLQNKIIENLLDYFDRPNLFIVGDPKQAIYRFQGASLASFEYLRKKYPTLKLIFLGTNYRSTSNILAVADSLKPSDTPLVAHDNTTTTLPITISDAESQSKELIDVATTIKQLLSDGTDPDEIAVLFKKNNEAVQIALILEAGEIPFIVDKGTSPLANEAVRKIISILYAVDHFGENGPFVMALHIEELGIDPIDIFRLASHAKLVRKNIAELIETEDMPHSITGSTAILNAYSLIKDLRKQSSHPDLASLVSDVALKTGILNKVVQNESLASLEAINYLIRIADKVPMSRNPGISSLLATLEAYEKYNIRVKKRDDDGPENKVRLITVHSAKGREFEHVFIVNCSDSSYGSSRGGYNIKLINSIYSRSGERLEAEEALDDARKALYVGITRAKRGLYISHHHFNEDGTPCPKSRLLDELDSSHITERSVEVDRKTLIQYSERGIATRTNKRSEGLSSFLLAILTRQSISHTSLDHYRKCPLNFLYQDLLGIKEAGTEAQSYGKLVHKALENLFGFARGHEPSLEYLLENFTKEAQGADLGPEELAEVLRKGKETLTVWYEWRTPKMNPMISVEKGIGSSIDVHIEGVRTTLKLYGKIDLLEYSPDGEVIITDFKTGEHKSRNAILKTMKNQLVFYSLLLGDTPLDHVAIEFVDKKEHPSPRREEFAVSSEDKAELVEEIERIVSDVVTLRFLAMGCKEATCHYCVLGSGLRGNFGV